MKVRLFDGVVSSIKRSLVTGCMPVDLVRLGESVDTTNGRVMTFCTLFTWWYIRKEDIAYIDRWSQYRLIYIYISHPVGTHKGRLLRIYHTKLTTVYCVLICGEILGRNVQFEQPDMGYIYNFGSVDILSPPLPHP